MAIALHDTTQRILLPGVRWCTYEALLADMDNTSAARLAYDHGTLEIMVPSFSHEQLNRLLAAIVEALAMSMHLDFINAGSTTFKREDVARGFEPDSCFYLQHVDAVRGHTAIDLATDPPPDLLIEIDLTHPSLDKLPIYAMLGVPEVWRYDGQHMLIYHLGDGTHSVVDTSVVLPEVTAQQLAYLVLLSATMPRHAWFAAIQSHVHQR